MRRRTRPVHPRLPLSWIRPEQVITGLWQAMTGRAGHCVQDAIPVALKPSTRTFSRWADTDAAQSSHRDEVASLSGRQENTGKPDVHGHKRKICPHLKRMSSMSTTSWKNWQPPPRNRSPPRRSRAPTVHHDHRVTHHTGSRGPCRPERNPRARTTSPT